MGYRTYRIWRFIQQQMHKFYLKIVSFCNCQTHKNINVFFFFAWRFLCVCVSLGLFLLLGVYIFIEICWLFYMGNVGFFYSLCILRTTPSWARTPFSFSHSLLFAYFNLNSGTWIHAHSQFTKTIRKTKESRKRKTHTHTPYLLELGRWERACNNSYNFLSSAWQDKNNKKNCVYVLSDALSLAIPSNSRIVSVECGRAI